MYTVKDEKERKLRKSLENRQDAEAIRIKRYLNMSDLSRTLGSPLSELMEKVKKTNILKDFDEIQIPEIVPTKESFDLFDFPAEHPARSKSDTYYIDAENILRTHTTVMWYYYFNIPEVRKRLEAHKPLGVISYGKVYRKDEIDRNHMNVFHQVDGLYICDSKERKITQKDLQNVLIEIAQAVFGKEIKYRFNPDTFPYTHDSLEMEVDKSGKWVEILGAGVVQPTVLEKLGVDSKKYNGWAFGFGLERLAIISMELPDIRLLWSTDPRVTKQLKLGNRYNEVSKFPPIVRDISFIVKNTFIPNDYFDLVREMGGDLIEEVALIDKYENENKFGKDNVSYAYRITYRSLDRTLTIGEVDAIHKKIEAESIKIFRASVR